MMTERYKFATESECGTFEAESFGAACDKLDTMLAGADGWVESADGGERYAVTTE